MQSTREFVREKLKELPRRQVISSVGHERGGIMKVESAGEFPRNRAQVYNINKQAKRQKVDGTVSTGDPQVLAKGEGRTARTYGRHPYQGNSLVPRAHSISSHRTAVS